MPITRTQNLQKVDYSASGADLAEPSNRNSFLGERQKQVLRHQRAYSSRNGVLDAAKGSRHDDKYSRRLGSPSHSNIFYLTYCRKIRSRLTITMSDYQYHSLFSYAPSVAAAAFFTSAFSLSALLHLSQAMYFRTWYMMPLVVGALCKLLVYMCKHELDHTDWSFVVETVGHIIRCLSASEDFGC